VLCSKGTSAQLFGDAEEECWQQHKHLWEEAKGKGKGKGKGDMAKEKGTCTMNQKKGTPPTGDWTKDRIERMERMEKADDAAVQKKLAKIMQGSKPSQIGNKPAIGQKPTRVCKKPKRSCQKLVASTKNPKSQKQSS